jgi:hypothetical protein
VIKAQNGRLDEFGDRKRPAKLASLGNTRVPPWVLCCFDLAARFCNSLNSKRFLTSFFKTNFS